MGEKCQQKLWRWLKSCCFSFSEWSSRCFEGNHLVSSCTFFHLAPVLNRLLCVSFSSHLPVLLKTITPYFFFCDPSFLLLLLVTLRPTWKRLLCEPEGSLTLHQETSGNKNSFFWWKFCDFVWWNKATESHQLVEAALWRFTVKHASLVIIWFKKQHLSARTRGNNPIKKCRNWFRDDFLESRTTWNKSHIWSMNPPVELVFPNQLGPPVLTKMS